VQREFYLQVFLARIFGAPDARWVLKGGTGLLIRMPGARYTKDIDLLHTDQDVDGALAEIREICGVRDGDPFRFIMDGSELMSGGVDGVRIKIAVFLGTAELERFTIDLSTRLEFVGRIDWRSPTPVIDLDELVSPLPKVALYPLPDQLADKVCAMFETHPTGVSGRYRDLVDLVLIIRECEFDARTVCIALAAESTRRRLQLPPSMYAPGPDWSRGYPATARDTDLRPELRVLETALDYVRACLDPVLSGLVTTHTWSPQGHTWISSRPLFGEEFAGGDLDRVPGG
jgi:hypothetical protein